MRFEWDGAKHEKTLQERDFGFDDGARVFAGPTVIRQDTRRDYGEERLRAVGETEGDIRNVVFTRRGAAVRIISVRRANRQETQASRPPA
jgi:uncharacterized DUF497 family protein